MPQKQWTDSAKRAMFDLYLSDPVYWTPRKLSIKTKMSVERIKAIIAMKRLEQSLVSQNKFKPNHEYVQYMEKILNAQDFPGKDKLLEPIEKKTKIAPTFVSIPEGHQLSREDAALILKRKPREDFESKAADVPLVNKPDVPGIFLRKDDCETNRRFSWIFVDIGKNTSPQVNYDSK